jgi:tRNA1(Val) A37 N6-methylase TrmN6
MSSTNLTSQNIRVRLKPNVFSHDGIEAMIQGVKNDPKLKEQPITKWLETMAYKALPTDFDAIIMNPPFTRRERILAEKDKLEEFVPEVRGKTRYWAYFVAGADRVLKKDGGSCSCHSRRIFCGWWSRKCQEFYS